MTGFRRSWDRIEALQVVDVLQGDSFDVRARCYVNATGPWIERVSQLSSGNAARIALSPTKGVHLVIPRINHEHGIYFQSRRDRRMIFLLPWGDDSLLGTTDTRFDKVADKVRPEMEDVEYLLDQLRSLAPSHAIQVDDVLTSFAGVRALIHSKRNPSRPFTRGANCRKR